MDSVEVLLTITNIEKSFDNKYFEDIKKNIKDIKKILKIPEEPYLLKAIQFNVTSNKYDIYICEKEPKNECYRKLILDDTSLKNLFCQILVCDDKSYWDGLDSETDITKYTKKIKNKTIYIIFTKNIIENSIYKIKNIVDLAPVFLGIDSLTFLKHQRLDRLVGMVKSTNKDIKYAIDVLKEFRGSLSEFNLENRENMIIFSGAVLTALGMTYTVDVDIMILKNKEPPSYMAILKERLLKINEEIDYTMLASDGSWYKDGKSFAYQKEWLTYKLPRLGGAKDIFDIALNPTHHFYYLGIKFISIELTVQKLLARGIADAYVDIIMLYKINELKIDTNICVPNLSVICGHIIVYNDFNLVKLYEKIQARLKLWHNYNMSVIDIKKILDTCAGKFKVYKKHDITDIDTLGIKKFHDAVKLSLIKKYAQNAEYLLDIRTCYSSETDIWIKNDIKNIYVIGSGKNKVNNIGLSKIIHVDGKSDSVWNGTFGKVKFNCITLMFTLHHMIKNIDMLVKNIDMVSKKGTKIIILCLNGNKIHSELFKKNKIIEIRNEQEPVFGIYNVDNIKFDMPRYQEMFVYLKGVPDMDKGVKEYLFDIGYVNSVFKEKGFNLIESEKLSNIHNDEYYKLTNLQKIIPSYYMSLVYEKN